jgi:glutathione synthase/RimK-type ligase-like ATP-grasp enzyme
VVVGDRQFGCAIHSDSLDFRTDYDNHRYERIVIPQEVADGVAALMREFQLVYAAIDFVVTPSGELVFIGDVNPGGQYGFLLPIAEEVTTALADLLTRKD